MTARRPAYDDVAGLVLAAGAGRRMGTPKALLVDPDGTPRMTAAVATLRRGGCPAVTVVVGAEADAAVPLAAATGAEVVVAERWADGMGESLRAGLEALEADDARAALVTLVDLPDVGPEVVRRVLAAWHDAGRRADALVRATYDGRPGHPVLLGRDHWAPLRDTVSGDVGAGPYLADDRAGRRVTEVSCEDLATGRDVDRPEDLR
ncbi:MAG TPA: nucleotidyltransferase family protein [Marmoricola sp.]|nr:nucleotidyltransferase family protein [Marmoricola sp.]